MNTLFSMIIEGEVSSKKNRYRIAGNRLIKDATTNYYTKFAWAQIKKAYPGFKPLTVQLHASIVFTYTRDKDLDNMLNGLFDVLQTCNVIANDKQIVVVVASKIKGKIPKTGVTLSEYNDPYGPRGVALS